MPSRVKPLVQPEASASLTNPSQSATLLAQLNIQSMKHLDLKSVYTTLTGFSLNAAACLAVARQLVEHLSIEPGIPRDEQLFVPRATKVVERFFGLSSKTVQAGDATHRIDVSLDENDRLVVVAHSFSDIEGHGDAFDREHQAVNIPLGRLMAVAV